MAKEFPYRSKTYLVVDTKDTFLLSIMKEILPNMYILEITDRHYDRVRIRGTKDYRVFETQIDTLYKDVNILQTIEINPN